MQSLELVSQEQVWAAVAAIEEKHTAGEINRADADRRINDCRRANTPRDLYKASGGLAGKRRRQDWGENAKAVYGLVFLLAAAAAVPLGVVATWSRSRWRTAGTG